MKTEKLNLLADKWATWAIEGNKSREDIKEAITNALEEYQNIEAEPSKNLTDEETSELYMIVSKKLNPINVTSILSNSEKLKIFLGARFIDIRCRKDGREYLFEGNFIRSIPSVSDGIDKEMRKLNTETFNTTAIKE